MADVIGPTFHRTGPTAGQLAMLIRLAGCNLACASCEVPFTWNRGQLDAAAYHRVIEIEALVEWISSGPAQLVVVTGGEPLLQPEGLLTLASQLSERGYRLQVETNGTVVPHPGLVTDVYLFEVWPKLRRFVGLDGSRSVDPINGEALAAFVNSRRAMFCVPVRTIDDVAELAELEQRHGLYPIWLVPEVVAHPPQVVAHMRSLADYARDRGWNLAPGLDVLLDETPRADALHRAGTSAAQAQTSIGRSPSRPPTRA